MKPLDLDTLELSPEMRLMLFCCTPGASRNPGNHDTGNRVDRGAVPGVDWDAFYRLTRFHKVIPAVSDAVQSFPSVPPDVAARFKKTRDTERLRALSLMGETVRLSKQLDQTGVRAIVLKGPVLALQLYGDISMRDAGDIDLLVNTRHLDSIHRLMTGNGYHVHPKEDARFFSSPRARKHHLKWFHHITYKHGEKKMRVEFHYRLFKNPVLYPLDMEALPDRARVFRHGGTGLRLLPPLDNLLYLFVHGAVHQWYHAKWLLDISRLMGVQTVDWDALFNHASGLGLERTAVQGVRLAHSLLDTPIPGQFPPGVWNKTNSKSVAKLTRSAALMISRSGGRMLPQPEFFSLERKPYMLRLKKSMAYKIRQLGLFLNLRALNFFQWFNRRRLKK